MPKRTLSPAALPATERRLRSALHQLLSSAEGFLHGSLIRVARRCGKKTCRCATDDEARHPALCLGQTRKGRNTMIHIPARLEARVIQWVGNFNHASALLEQLNEQGRERINQAKRKAAAEKATAARHTAKKANPKPPRKPS